MWTYLNDIVLATICKLYVSNNYNLISDSVENIKSANFIIWLNTTLDPIALEYSLSNFAVILCTLDL